MSNQIFKFYLPANNPSGLLGTVGGSITTTELEPRLGSLFADMNSSPVSTVNQYRKLHIKQVEEGTFENVYVELGNVEHVTQVSFTIATSSSDTSTSPLIIPTGYTVGNFTGTYANSLLALSSSTEGSTFAIWIRQSIPPGADDDSLASFTIRVRATQLS